VTTQKYNSYNYVKIKCVFTPNSRGLWHQFWVGPVCRFCTFLYVNSYFLGVFFLDNYILAPFSYCFMKWVSQGRNEWWGKNLGFCVFLDVMISHMKHWSHTTQILVYWENAQQLFSTRPYFFPIYLRNRLYTNTTQHFIKCRMLENKWWNCDRL